MFSCEEEIVCYYIWEISTGEFIATVSNGKMNRAGSEGEKCLEIVEVTEKDVGRQYCRKRSNGFSFKAGKYY